MRSSATQGRRRVSRKIEGAIARYHVGIEDLALINMKGMTPPRRDGSCLWLLAVSPVS
jgi:hypothetical protein